MRNSPPFRAVIPHQQVRHPRVTQPSATRTRKYAFDLHVLGTPPAFTLSQDQTLHHENLSLFENPSFTRCPSKGNVVLFLHSRRSLYSKPRFVPAPCSGTHNRSIFSLVSKNSKEKTSLLYS